ncbi:MAG TPA: hypothetical protein VMQ81_01270 [Acidimicrobiia bacterium]|nr:hypothetical protein [Acidimicrobiia bacterium]
MTRHNAGLRLLAWMWLPAILLLAAIVVQDGVPDRELLSDPAQITDSSASTGLVSNLGMVAWTGAAAALLGAAYVLRRLLAPRERVALLVSAGLFTVVLLVDDLFLLHERTVEDKLGIPEVVTIAVYALAALGWAILFRRQLRSTPFVLAAIALAGLGVSAVVDLAHPGRWSQPVLEDGSKFLAILAWAAYAGQLSRDLVLEAAAQPGAAPGPPPAG